MNCVSCGHARVFHQVGTGAGVPVGEEYCDDRYSIPCACTRFKEPVVYTCESKFSTDTAFTFTVQETSMKRSATNVIAYFYVGSANRARCRLVIGGNIEIQSKDGLGVSTWVRADGTKMPSREKIMAAALKQVFDELPGPCELRSSTGFPDNRFYPTGVTCTSQCVGIELGTVEV